MKTKLLAFATKYITVLALILSTGRVNATLNNPNTDWLMNDQVGIFSHWLMGFNDISTDPAQWNNMVNSFNVTNYVNQVRGAGVKYVVLTLGQGRGYYCSPNAKWDSLLAAAGLPARSPTRDLPLDLYNELNKYGIRLMLYFVGDPSNQEGGAGLAALGYNGTYDNSTYRNNVMAMAKEWSDRYGSKVSGWWIDGVTRANFLGSGQLPTYASNLKDGNANAIVAFNPGVGVSKMDNSQDFTAGEQNDIGQMPTNRWVQGVQWHVLVKFDANSWAGGGVQEPANQTAAWVSQVKGMQGVVSFNCQIFKNGTMNTNQVSYVQQCVAVVPTPAGSDLALNKSVTTSSDVNSTQNGPKAVDGNQTTKWCSLPESTNPGDKWLRIDLGSAQTIATWAVSHAQINGESWTLNTKDFKLQKSSDGTTWADVDNVVSNTIQMTDRPITPFSSRYVRLYITAAVQPGVADTANNARIYEMALYPPVSGGSLANGTYKLIVRHSGLALDVSHQSTTNGSPLEQWTYNGGNNQRWTLTSLGGNTYKIVGVQSGRTLEVAGASTANGALVDIWDSNNAANQKWTITPTDSGYYSVVNVNSGKSMEVFGGVTATNAGAAVDQWSGTQFNQQWSFQAP